MQFRRVSGRDSAQVVTPFVQVGTYPTRNFAGNCYLMTVCDARLAYGGLVVSANLPTSPQGPDHLILFVMEEGRRMVSEDSQDLRGFAVIHRLCDFRNLDDAFHREMPPDLHEIDDLCELLEVRSLRCSERIVFEERNDGVAKVTDPLDAIPEHVFPVIVMPAISIDLAASEEPNQFLKNITTRRALTDGKLGSNLPSQGHLAARVDRTAETTLSVYESDDPSDRLESFLLVFRTPNIVTAIHDNTLQSWCDRNDE